MALAILGELTIRQASSVGLSPARSPEGERLQVAAPGECGDGQIRGLEVSGRRLGRRLAAWASELRRVWVHGLWQGLRWPGFLVGSPGLTVSKESKFRDDSEAVGTD